MTEPIFTLTADNGRPHTMNELARDNKWAARARTQTTRQLWWAIGNNNRVRDAGLTYVTIEVIPLHATNRSPQDTCGCAPEAKAAIDGLVDAGLIPNDDPTHLGWVLFRPPRRGCGVDGMTLVIYDGGSTGTDGTSPTSPSL